MYQSIIISYRVFKYSFAHISWARAFGKEENGRGNALVKNEGYTNRPNKTHPTAGATHTSLAGFVCGKPGLWWM